MLLRSQDYSATWTAASLTPVTGRTAPDGTATGTEFTASGANGTLTQAVTAIAADYTFSVWLRRVTGSGNIDISAHSGGTWVTQTITSSWARYTVTQTLTAGTRTPGIRIVTSGDQIEVWGAQLEQRSAATAYTPTTTQAVVNYVPTLLTAPAGVPRFDHNPVTGESLGLLVEEQRTNLITYSQQLNSTYYNNGYAGGTFLPNCIVAPDGTLTGSKLIPNSGATETWWGKYNIQQVNVTAGQTYTISCYFKAGEFSTVRLVGDLRDAGGLSIDATFVLSGSGTATIQSGTAATITPVGNGWYRCTATGAAGITTDEEPGITWNGAGATGNGFNGFYAWGFQLEVGAFPTSYIPTGAAAVTRSADDASMTGANFSSWYNQNEGTAVIETKNVVDTGGSGGWYIGTVPAPRWWAYSYGVTELWNGNEGQTVSYGYAGSRNAMKFAEAVSHRNKTRNGSINGSAAISTAWSSILTPRPVDRMVLGNRVDSVEYLNGCISKFTFYPIALAAAQLQALTA